MATPTTHADTPVQAQACATLRPPTPIRCATCCWRRLPLVSCRAPTPARCSLRWTRAPPVPEQTLVALQDDAVVGVYLISWPLLWWLRLRGGAGTGVRW